MRQQLKLFEPVIQCQSVVWPYFNMSPSRDIVDVGQGTNPGCRRPTHSYTLYLEMKHGLMHWHCMFSLSLKLNSAQHKYNYVEKCKWQLNWNLTIYTTKGGIFSSNDADGMFFFFQEVHLDQEHMWIICTLDNL